MRLIVPQVFDVTILPNVFIDQYMTLANGEFVKIYIYLLRCAGTDRCISVSSIADHFDQTEKDVLRALSYWEKTGLLKLVRNENNEILDVILSECKNEAACQISPDMQGACTLSGYVSEGGVSPQAVNIASINETEISLAADHEVKREEGDNHLANPAVSEIPAMQGTDGSLQTHMGETGNDGLNISRRISSNDIPDKELLTPQRRKELAEDEMVQQLLLVYSMYLGRDLISTEISNIMYFYDTLGFSFELIDFLLEYCISNDKLHERYISAVAIDWYRNRIATVAEAKKYINRHTRVNKEISEALGLRGYDLTAQEKEYIERWIEEYGMPLEVIKEACSRTILSIHKPSFQYTNAILEKWHKMGIQSVDSIR